MSNFCQVAIIATAAAITRPSGKRERRREIGIIVRLLFAGYIREPRSRKETAGDKNDSATAMCTYVCVEISLSTG